MLDLPQPCSKPNLGASTLSGQVASDEVIEKSIGAAHAQRGGEPIAPDLSGGARPPGKSTSARLETPRQPAATVHPHP
jgi:hypothetical protein